MYLGTPLSKRIKGNSNSATAVARMKMIQELMHFYFFWPEGAESRDGTEAETGSSGQNDSGRPDVSAAALATHGDHRYGVLLVSLTPGGQC